MQLPVPRLCAPRHKVTATSSPGLGTQGTWDAFSTPYLPQLAVSDGSNLGPFPVYFAQLKSRSCPKRELAAPGGTRCQQGSTKVGDVGGEGIILGVPPALGTPLPPAVLCGQVSVPRALCLELGLIAAMPMG